MAVVDILERVRRVEREYCKADIVYFVETYCHIEDKDSDEILQRFRMWPVQRDALVSIHTHRLNAVLKARQLGVSWMAVAKAMHRMLFWPGSLVIALSRTELEAKELVRRLGVQAENMPELVGEGTGVACKPKKLELELCFQSGAISTFMGMASSANAGRSFTADLLLMDEWAFQQFAYTIWQAGYPTINRPSGGQVIGVSTIARGTLFEEIFTGENDFNKIFIPWNADPARTPEWYEGTRKALGDDKMMQEYPATVAEALTIPGGAFFPEVRAHTHMVDLPEGMEYRRRYVCLDYGLDMLHAVMVEVDSENQALATGEVYGADMDIETACGAIREMVDGRSVELYLAPPDLWSREQLTGRSRADWFTSFGVPLAKTSNDFAAGCAAMKQWLRVGEKESAEGVRTVVPPALRFVRDAVPELVRCLLKIQKDPKRGKDPRRANVYAKQPHDLTHAPDALRCFCVYWAAPGDTPPEKDRPRWTEDMLEDWRRATPEERAYLESRWGGKPK